MKSRLFTILISFLFLIVAAVVAKSASAQVWPACGETTVPDCLAAGQMCINTTDGPPYHKCGAGSLTYESTELQPSSPVGEVIGGVNASGIYGYFSSNVEYPGGPDPRLCLGSQAYCSTFPFTNNIWSASAANPANYVKPSVWDYGFNGLRSGRSYVFTKAEGYSTYPGLFAIGQSPLLTTWPGYGFTPTNKNTDSGCVGGVCGRDISWTTPFPGDSVVRYGINPPTWTNSYTSLNPSEFFQASVSLPTKESWGVGYFGTIIYRNVLGAWSTLINPDPLTRYLYSIDMTDNRHGWIVGASGLTMTTSNGQQWTVVSPPLGFTSSLRLVVAPTQKTAWAFGDAESILKYDSLAGTWSQQVFPGRDTGQVIWSAASVDGVIIVAGGVNGRIIRTINGGSSWAVSSIGSATETINTMATLDGITFWAGGSSGSLWNSSDSGSSWSLVRSLPSSIISLTLQSPTSVQFVSGDSVYNYNSATNSLVQDNAVTAQLGANPYTVTSITSGHYLAMASNRVAEYSMPIGSIPLSDASLTTTHALTLTPSLNPLLPATTYYFSAESTGSGVSSGALGSFTTPVLENVPPTVNMNTPTTPTPGTWYFRDWPLTFTGTAGDAAPGTLNNVRVIFGFSNYSFMADLDAGGNWTATIPNSADIGNTISSSNGWAYPVKAIATDDSGNTAETSVDNFVIDPFPPDYTEIWPKPATPTSTATVTSNAGCIDNWSTIANLELRVTSGGITSLTSIIKPEDIGKNSVEIPFSVTLQPGANDIRIICTDGAGNGRSDAMLVNFIPPVPDFSVYAAPPASNIVDAGQSSTFVINSDAIDGFSGAVNLTASFPGGAPAGMTVSFAPASINLGGGVTTGSAILTVNSQAGPASDTVITVTGSSGAFAPKSDNVVIHLNQTPIPPDFIIACNVNCNQNVVAGTTTTYAIDATAFGGFGGQVNLSASFPDGAPAGMTASFGATTPIVFINGTRFSPPPVLTVTTPTGLASGPHTITITGTSGAITKTTTVQLSLTASPPQPDFTLTCSGLCTKAIAAGGTVTYQMNVTGDADYDYDSIAHPFVWTTGSLPAGVTATFGAFSGDPTAGGTGTVTLTINAAVAVVATTIDVNANDGNYLHTVAVGIGPVPDFNMVVTPVDSTVTAGSPQRATYNIQLTAINGFNRSVHLDFESNPQDLVNIVPTFGQEDVTPTAGGVSVTLNIEVKSPYQDITPQVALQITGLATAVPGFPAIQKTAADNMDVSPDVTPPSISNEVASVSDHDATITWLTDEPANSTVTVYSDEDQTTVVNTSSLLDYCVQDCHSIVTGALNSSTTYYYSITSVDQAFPVPNSGEKLENGIVPLQFTTSEAPDDEYPVVQINQPVTGDTISGTNNINVTASDNNVMASLRLEIAPAVANENLFRVDTTTTCPSTLSCDMNPIFTWDTLATTPNGTYTITVTALSTTGPAISASTSINVTVYNDRQPPKVIGNPTSSGLDCTGPMGTCSIMINWTTDAPSTSEVEYGLAVDCEGARTLPDGTVVACAYTDSELGNYVDAVTSPDLSATFTAHSVELTGLLPDRLYHYRITSCTNNLYCTN